MGKHSGKDVLRTPGAAASLGHDILGKLLNLTKPQFLTCHVGILMMVMTMTVHDLWACCGG